MTSLLRQLVYRYFKPVSSRTNELFSVSATNMAVFVANPGSQGGVSCVLGQKRSRPWRRPTTKGLEGPGCSSEGGCPLKGQAAAARAGARWKAQASAARAEAAERAEGAGRSGQQRCPKQLKEPKGLKGPGYSSETMSQVKWAMMPAQKPAMVWAPMALLMSLR